MHNGEGNPIHDPPRPGQTPLELATFEEIWDELMRRELLEQVILVYVNEEYRPGVLYHDDEATTKYWLRKGIQLVAQNEGKHKGDCGE